MESLIPDYQEDLALFMVPFHGLFSRHLVEIVANSIELCLQMRNIKYAYGKSAVVEFFSVSSSLRSRLVEAGSESTS